MIFRPFKLTTIFRVGWKGLPSSIRTSADFKDIDKCYKAANTLILKAGELILECNKIYPPYVPKKSNIDLVTETDKEVERILFEGLKECFPDHQFIGEEDSSKRGAVRKLTDAPTWIIDPIDGTMNFVHTFPHSCISVGLVVNRMTELGIIYNPSLEQHFSAIHGRGAYYNGGRMCVSGEKEISKALITTEYLYSRDPAVNAVVYENFIKLGEKVHAIRCLGSSALNIAMVAQGGADANHTIGAHAWDVCAGELIVREAGGVVIDTDGGEFDLMSRRIIAASSMELAQELARIQIQYCPEPRDDE